MKTKETAATINYISKETVYSKVFKNSRPNTLNTKPVFVTMATRTASLRKR